MRIFFKIRGAELLGCLLLAIAFVGRVDADESPIKVRGDFSQFKDAVAGGKARVVFLGGSITQNTKGHTAMLPAWLEEQYPDCEFTFENAGLSSTCSTTGAFRLQRDVLAGGPVDLLVVEFAVNDDQDAAHSKVDAIRGMEGIVRQMKLRSPGADLLMVYFANPELVEKLKAGEVPVSIDAHAAVAEHYGITTVGVAQALANGAMEWDAYGGTHPGKEGYRMASDMMIEALMAGMEKSEEEGASGVLPEPLDGQNYDRAEFLDVQAASWLGGWKYGEVSKEMIPVGAIRGDYEGMPLLRAEVPGTMLYLNFSGRAIGAFVLAGPDSALLEVSVDAGEWQEVETYHKHSGGLNYPRSVMFATGLELERGHQLALRVKQRETGDDDKEQGGSALNLLMFEINR